MTTAPKDVTSIASVMRAIEASGVEISDLPRLRRKITGMHQTYARQIITPASCAVILWSALNTGKSVEDVLAIPDKDLLPFVLEFERRVYPGAQPAIFQATPGKRGQRSRRERTTQSH